MKGITFYFTYGKRTAEYGFKEKTKIKILTYWGRQKSRVDQDLDSQYCWFSFKTANYTNFK